MSNVNVGKNKSKRIFYFDALRALAIFAVIIFHVGISCTKMVSFEYSIPTLKWLFNDFVVTFFRCGVDIFLMLSGALSLGRVWDIKTFLGKRIPRIVSPFLFWGFVLSLVLVVISLNFPNLIHTLDSYNLMGFLNYLYMTYMAKNYGFSPYWFFWMILGTYLIMPILNKWLLHSDLKEVEYFLVIWLITCLFDYTLFIPFPIKLSYFSGAIGMVVLGYYLRHTERKLLNNPYFAIVLLLIGSIGMMYISYLNSTVSSFYLFERYNILMAIEVSGIFLLFKNFSKFNININFFNNENGIYHKSIFSLAKYSYGIYLVHRVIINLFYLIFKQVNSYKLMFIILLVGSLFLSWGLLALLNRVPYINQVIGAK